ncbi:hypothetical protein AZO1586I_667 [Bathymodiolus thermophilus thioautotrophic gill symbiont]|jgi:hypothetical protein|uniref:Uncharacterized protein n=3 Tax=sulfur-oxidizing symbionts TaxID=32036 RepID=A0A1H6LNI5_9GAMM|nr:MULTISPECIES: hypothetical protein [sulfur-oxidizing symbionts]CAC9494316.1 hypothetical protein [uncultured Gammaproteobacteria bacterium]CAB5500205.1 hypothetical protein AZO1586R_1054 [Bathymodiolus azoricus thioautotrophic gill symbiont]CAB5500533.1 hypothetical protein AZO1586I_667 [Bathymodiolus thermophilus thioautotrophic gill symbiont]CAC9506523.1 hypothetical protein [uncultured Gammaproteobacteria bacterium]CAC9536679.1 hypothetical protein [uncultured Gammaproteobacteria bacteri
MNNTIKVIISWLIALWASNVFLSSLFYKFDNTALEPQHIFGTIGIWISDTINTTLGELFTEYGAILIGLAELATALVLLSPIVLWKHREKLHCIGGLMASVVMVGAIFFHIVTPLGWHPTWQVVNEVACQAVFIAPNSCADTSLANVALSILVLGVVMVWLNKKPN